eukprot:2712951-Pyramimonas_sp.AAC.1
MSPGRPGAASPPSGRPSGMAGLLGRKAQEVAPRPHDRPETQNADEDVREGGNTSGLSLSEGTHERRWLRKPENSADALPPRCSEHAHQTTCPSIRWPSEPSELNVL